MDQCPDPQPVLAGLKDFQRRTVNYVFQRMYLDTDATRRFLIADEVGLGKTLVARGLIARAVETLWERVPRIDIVYLCSNSDIARQNINRLNITGNRDFALPSRITLLPITVQRLDQNRINFISLTPSTSLDLKSSTGTWKERSLLYHMLATAWDLRGVAALNVLESGMKRSRFRDWTSRFRDWYQIDGDLEEGFISLLAQTIQEEKARGDEDLRSRFDRLCDACCHRKHDRNLPDSVRTERNAVIVSLRTLLAKSCISALEPDLIILDEFQRFRHLLDGDTEEGMLAQDLFTYVDADSAARVLLLSATPYKMYTIDDEQNEDHYKDFVRTVDFLLNDGETSQRFAQLLSGFRHELLHLNTGGTGQAIEFKGQIEDTLRRIMVRTERLSTHVDRNGMLVDVDDTHSVVEMQDIASYLGMQDVARLLGQPDTLEYWKSAPYLLNFMEGYKLKQALKDEIAVAPSQSAVAAVLSNGSGLLLDQTEITGYAAVDPRNARLRSLLAVTVDAGLWQLLWMPPSLPYYQPDGPFAAVGGQSVTKRLIFSSWRVVPKVIATLASYEAERRMIRAFDMENPENTVEARRRRRPLLRFARSEGRLSNMTTLGIIYPSFVLAELGDPLAFFARHTDDSSLLTVDLLLQHIEDRVARKLDALQVDVKSGGSVDESWYWAAPILLDLQEDPVVARTWLENPSLATDWAAGDEDGHEDEETGGPTAQSAWADHVALAQAMAQKRPQLGPQPKDLAQVLAQMALGAPAIAALRALSRIAGGTASVRQPAHRLCAGQIAWAFLTLFNLPETMALVRSEVWTDGRPTSEPYWQRVLRYSITGNIQAVLDEYVHLLREALGLLDQPDEDIASAVKDAVRSALALRTVNLTIDDIQAAGDTGQMRIDPYRLRSRFALRYGDSQTDYHQHGMRADQVRGAFNSPFWPFILATTSVGQEGLDFHMYCHAVVHWNLPSNPVDLEQREGRVHRYKGHAVRKNLARSWSSTIQNGRAPTDPWSAMFNTAARESDTDLEPFWIYPLADGAKIERYVPALPLSQDVYRFRRLRKSLAVYRMVLGQSRQEDMLDYLMHIVPESEIPAVSEQLQMNLEPPASGEDDGDRNR